MKDTLYSIFGSIAIISTIIGMIPQIFKTFKTKSMSDVSLLVLVNYFITSLSWFVYGIGIYDNMIIFSNLISIIVSIVLLVQKFIYKRKIY